MNIQTIYVPSSSNPVSELQTVDETTLKVRDFIDSLPLEKQPLSPFEDEKKFDNIKARLLSAVPELGNDQDLSKRYWNVFCKYAVNGPLTYPEIKKLFNLTKNHQSSLSFPPNKISEHLRGSYENPKSYRSFDSIELIQNPMNQEWSEELIQRMRIAMQVFDEVSPTNPSFSLPGENFDPEYHRKIAFLFPLHQTSFLKEKWKEELCPNIYDSSIQQEHQSSLIELARKNYQEGSNRVYWNAIQEGMIIEDQGKKKYYPIPAIRKYLPKTKKESFKETLDRLESGIQKEIERENSLNSIYQAEFEEVLLNIMDDSPLIERTRKSIRDLPERDKPLNPFEHEDRLDRIKQSLFEQIPELKEIKDFSSFYWNEVCENIYPAPLNKKEVAFLLLFKKKLKPFNEKHFSKTLYETNRYFLGEVYGKFGLYRSQSSISPLLEDRSSKDWSEDETSRLILCMEALKYLKNSLSSTENTWVESLEQKSKNRLRSICGNKDPFEEISFLFPGRDSSVLSAKWTELNSLSSILPLSGDLSRKYRKIVQDPCFIAVQQNIQNAILNTPEEERPLNPFEEATKLTRPIQRQILDLMPNHWECVESDIPALYWDLFCPSVIHSPLSEEEIKSLLNFTIEHSLEDPLVINPVGNPRHSSKVLFELNKARYRPFCNKTAFLDMGLFNTNSPELQGRKNSMKRKFEQVEDEIKNPLLYDLT